MFRRIGNMLYKEEENQKYVVGYVNILQLHSNKKEIQADGIEEVEISIKVDNYYGRNIEPILPMKIKINNDIKFITENPFKFKTNIVDTYKIETLSSDMENTEIYINAYGNISNEINIDGKDKYIKELESRLALTEKALNDLILGGGI